MLFRDGFLMFRQWQHEGEGTALALLAVPSQFSADAGGQVARDVQPQSIAFSSAGIGSAVEGGEETAAFGLGNAHARVGDIEVDVSGTGVRPQRDGAAGGRIFDGVGDEVFEY